MSFEDVRTDCTCPACSRCGATVADFCQSGAENTPQRQESASAFERIAAEIGALVAEKNAAYGDSFRAAAEIMRALYPDGIRPEQYVDALGVVRVIDKLKRIATDRDALGESPWRDIAGYGVLGAAATES